MARTYESLDETVRSFIAEQPLFFVASAPDGPDGHVNLSPKGLDSFRVIDEHTVAHLDRIQSSCGYAVPLMKLTEQRSTLIDWAERRGPNGLADYWDEKNETSIDGLPGHPGAAP